MMAYEGTENTRKVFGKFINQFQSTIKALVQKFERILIKLYRHVSLLSNQTCLNEGLLPNHTHTHTHTHLFNKTNIVRVMVLNILNRATI